MFYPTGGFLEGGFLEQHLVVARTRLMLVLALSLSECAITESLAAENTRGRVFLAIK
jgi:hypothetical protein